MILTLGVASQARLGSATKLRKFQSIKRYVTV
jgi:hypothetical protein